MRLCLPAPSLSFCFLLHYCTHTHTPQSVIPSINPVSPSFIIFIFYPRTVLHSLFILFLFLFFFKKKNAILVARFYYLLLLPSLASSNLIPSRNWFHLKSIIQQSNIRSLCCVSRFCSLPLSVSLATFARLPPLPCSLAAVEAVLLRYPSSCHTLPRPSCEFFVSRSSFSAWYS